jgi:hypothetical protein
VNDPATVQAIFYICAFVFIAFAIATTLKVFGLVWLKLSRFIGPMLTAMVMLSSVWLLFVWLVKP